MPEVTHAGEEQPYTELLGGGDDFAIPEASARFDEGGNTVAGSQFQPIGEGKEGV